VVGRLFGIVGLFVAVPVISAIVILTEEFWVKEMEAAHQRRSSEELALPPPVVDTMEEEREEKPALFGPQSEA
jgi:hypothetical protein